MARTSMGLVLLFVALLALSGLYFYAGSVEPQDTFIGEIQEGDEGELVRVEGVINHVWSKGSSTGFELVDPEDGSNIKVFCRFGIEGTLKERLVSGTGVEVTGEVSVFKDHVEVVVEKAGDMEVTAFAEANKVRMGTIYQNKEVFDNMTVSIKGTVDDMSLFWGDLSLDLNYGANKARVRINDFSPQVPFAEGSTISVVGRVWFDEDGLLRISASGWRGVTVDV